MLKNGLIKGKVHMRDIKQGTHPREVPVLIVGKQKFYSPPVYKDQLATHDDCVDCNKEFEKEFSNSRRCNDCYFIFNHSKYMEKPFKEWDGEGFVYSQSLDMYFDGSAEIDDYINDLEEDEMPNQLNLVICKPNMVFSITSEIWSDILPEGEAPDSLEELISEFNKKLGQLPALSWSPGEFRTDYYFHKGK